MRQATSVILFCLILAVAGLAHAHRTSVYAYVEGGRIKGEGYMPGGGKVSNQPVQLLNAGGKVLAETKTARDGSFSLPVPKGQPPFQLVLNAGAGHRATFDLNPADFGVPEKAAAAQKPAPAARQAPTAGTSAPELCVLVQQAVDKSLAPVRAQLAEMALRSEKASLKGIIGGLGWIAGLLGLAAYLKARKMAKGAR